MLQNGKSASISKIDCSHSFRHTASMLRQYSPLLFAAFICIIPQAHAFTGTQNMNISVIVPPIVQVSATPMDFGNVVTTQTAQATAVITVNMVATQTYNISLDAGRHKSSERRMSDGKGNFHSYVLYKNTARTQRWGDNGFAGTYAAGSSLASTGTGSNQSFIVYGTTPKAASAPGNYSDSVTVTVNY